MVTTDARADLLPPEAARLPSGARSSALVAGASAASILANYVFLLVAGRVLGSAGYGSLAALLGLLAVVLIPAAALQMAVSREISRRVAAGDDVGTRAFVRATLRTSLVATVPLVVVALALAVPLANLLHIDSVATVVVAELTLSTALVLPVAMGVVQGYQRFYALAALYIAPFAIRLPLFGIAIAVGARLGGAIVATLIGSVATAAFAFELARRTAPGAEELRRSELTTFLRYLVPVAAGLVGIALLTHLDILVVKARLSATDAGAYAAASAFARVGFFLPATILTVLFPRTAARQARGQQTADILGRSLLATAVFCALLALFYAATGVGIVSLTFGRDFAHGGRVLAPFALAIGLYSLAYILVGYHLSRGEARYAWIVAGSVPVQLVVLALVPRSLHAVVWANLAVAAVVVASHEVLVGSSRGALAAALSRIPAARRAQARAVVTEAALVLFATTLFVCLLMWRVVVHLGSTIIGGLGTDSTGSVSFLWTLQHESGYHVLGTTHHTLSGAPFGWDEGNGLNVQWLLPYYPAYLLTKLFGAVAAYNLITLAGYVLSGAAMYLLVRYLGCGRLVAAWATLVFVLFPWHLARAEHASLTHLEVLVLLVLALVAAARRPTPIRFALVGLATLACWLTSGYFGGMAVITVIAFAAGTLAVRRQRDGLVLAGGSIAAAIVASGVVGIASYASGTNTGAGIEREASALTAYGLRPLELVVPAARHLFFGSGLDSFWARHAHGSNVTEMSNDLGIVTFALAAGWFVWFLRRRERRPDGLWRRQVAAGLVAAFVVGFLFALPSPVGGISMPSKLLWNVLPAFRVPSRWDPLLMTALLPLAALGLQAASRTVARRHSAAPVALVAVAAVASFVELATHPVGHFRTTPVPPEYVDLDRKVPDGILAEYPLGYSDIYRLWQRVHGRPLVNGAPEGSTADQARLQILDPAEPGTAQSLSLLGVTAVAIHTQGHADAPVQPREPTAGEGYRLVGRYSDGTSVWRVTAPAAPAFVTFPSGFAAPRLVENHVAFPLVGAPALVQLRSKRAGVVRVVFDAIPPDGAPRQLVFSDNTGDHPLAVRGPTHFELDVEIVRGVSDLSVRSEPATSEDQAVLLTQPSAAPTTGKPVLLAGPSSGDPGF